VISAQEVVFQKATSGRQNSTMMTDRRKFITKLSLYGMASFYSISIQFSSNQFKVVPLACTLRSRYRPKKSLRRTRHHGMPQCDNDGCGLITTLAEGKDRPYKNDGKLGHDPVCRHFIEWHIFPFSSSRIAALWDIGTLATQR